MSNTKFFLIFLSPGVEEERIVLTPLSWNVTSSFVLNVLLFLYNTSTAFVPLLARTIAAAPELLPIPISPKIRSVLLALGPL